MQYSLGCVSEIEYVARHFAKRAPSSRYSSSRLPSPSSPSVTVSPSASASGFAPLSTLIPGMTPFEASSSGNGVPSSERCRIVSSKRMTPLMNSSTPGVVKRRLRYARRLSSVDSTPIVSKRFLIVPSLSSAARMPFPSATSARAVSCSSVFGIGNLLLAVLSSIMARLQSPEPADVAQLVEHWLPKPRVAGSSPVVRFAAGDWPAPASKRGAGMDLRWPGANRTAVGRHVPSTYEEPHASLTRTERGAPDGELGGAAACLLGGGGTRDPDARARLARRASLAADAGRGQPGRGRRARRRAGVARSAGLSGGSSAARPLVAAQRGPAAFG